MKDIRDVWKFPLKCMVWKSDDDSKEMLDIYIKDNCGNVVMNWCYFNIPVEIGSGIVALINGDEISSEVKDWLSKYKFVRDNEFIYRISVDDDSSEKPVKLLKMRSWGYLTGVGGLKLSNDDAWHIQQRMLEYVEGILNN